MTEFVIGDEKYYPNEPNNCSHGDIDYDGTCKLCGISEGEIGEVNTSYDQDQPIGDTPSDYPAVGGEPIDAETGQDFYDIQMGGQAPRIGEYENVWKIIKGESLNKDGTGVARATRGVNPNKAKHKVLKFEYVSNSDCPICKEFDGKTFAIDSPNRPVIPRLESQGKKGGRPYTHPNCKCKWVNVFSESKSTEVDKATLNRARKWYGGDFDQLTLLEQKVVVVDMFKSILGIEAIAEEFDFIDPVPFASMAKLVFDAIKPTIQDKLGLVNEDEEPEHIISEEKFKEDEHPRDNDGKFGSGGGGNEEKDPNRHDDNTHIQFWKGYVKDSVDDIKNLEEELSVMKEEKLWVSYSDKTENQLVGMIKSEKKVLAKKEATLARKMEGFDFLETDEFKKPFSMYDFKGDKSITDTLMPRYENLETKGWEIDDYKLETWVEDMGEEIRHGEKNWSKYQQKYNDLKYRSLTGNDNQVRYAKKQMPEMENVWKYWRKHTQQAINTKEYLQKLRDEGFTSERTATEGGRGSGKNGHQKWMLGAEAGEECENCMVITEFEDGKCMICGN